MMPLLSYDLTLVQHERLAAIAPQYAGFDGIMLSVEAVTDGGEVHPINHGIYREIFCDRSYMGLRKVYVGLSRELNVTRSDQYEFAGFDVGWFEPEYGCYSIIAWYVLAQGRSRDLLNKYLLLDTRQRAQGLLDTWSADLAADKETFENGEILQPIAVFRCVSPEKPRV